MNKRGRKSNKWSKARTNATVKQEQALDLRKSGLSYTKIAAAMGIGVATAHNYVSRALEKVSKVIEQKARELRSLELTRLDEMLDGIYNKAITGDTDAIDRVLKIMERRAKLTGINAPDTLGVETTTRVIFEPLTEQEMAGMRYPGGNGGNGKHGKGNGGTETNQNPTEATSFRRK